MPAPRAAAVAWGNRGRDVGAAGPSPGRQEVEQVPGAPSTLTDGADSGPRHVSQPAPCSWDTEVGQGAEEEVGIEGQGTLTWGLGLVVPSWAKALLENTGLREWELIAHTQSRAGDPGSPCPCLSWPGRGTGKAQGAVGSHRLPLKPRPKLSVIPESSLSCAVSDPSGNSCWPHLRSRPSPEPSLLFHC